MRRLNSRPGTCSGSILLRPKSSCSAAETLPFTTSDASWRKNRHSTLKPFMTTTFQARKYRLRICTRTDSSRVVVRIRISGRSELRAKSKRSDFISGLGQEIGEIRCQIYNKETENVTVAYQEVIPWFIRVYLSKLNIRSQPRDGRTDRTLQIKPRMKIFTSSIRNRQQLPDEVKTDHNWLTISNRDKRI